MKKNTYHAIITELNQTGQISQKLLHSLSAPIIIKMFYNLFGPSGTYQLNDNAYHTILTELKDIEGELPDISVPYPSSTLIHLFYDKIGRHVTSETVFEEDGVNAEEETNNLTVDDLLDLLNFANEDHDEFYAEQIKNRLYQICSI
jgi:hypothetical protein